MPHASRSARRGYTLTELMVVVLIMVIMMALALPAVRRASEDARVREASRQVQAFFTMAKARAAATGRVAGVEFVVQKGVDNSPFATQMYLCESPNLFGGATTGSLARVNGSSLLFSDSNDPGIVDSLVPTGEGFLIRFNFRGEWYAAVNNGGNNFGLLLGAPYTPAVAPPTQGVPFQIRRAPVRVGNPSELPAGTAVDLFYSGVGPVGTEFADADTRLQVIFAPNGNIERLIFDRINSLPQVNDAPGSAVYFLIGQAIKIGDRTASGLDSRQGSNIFEGTNLWVSAGRLTGAVATSEIAPTDLNSAKSLIENARTFAINREQMKGK